MTVTIIAERKRTLFLEIVEAAIKQMTAGLPVSIVRATIVDVVDELESIANYYNKSDSWTPWRHLEDFEEDEEAKE